MSYSQPAMKYFPEPVAVTCCYSRTWQRFLGIPYRRYIAIGIVGHGSTQARSRKEIEHMVRDFLACQGKDPWQRLVIEWV